ncbi:MAG TPA: response regulator [Kofleriaceae bacterium]|nr:response regulator [Kofleriaceae bacterium]
MADTDGIPAPVEDVDTSPAAAVGQILVVDDVPANLVAMEAMLEPLGRPIKTARSGEQALALVLEHEFALVLLDVNMPGMDGYETVRWIRARERTRLLPVIFVTAEDRDSDAVARAYELGAIDFLFKPVRAEILRSKAAMFVALQERTEQLAAERLERDFETRRREHEALALRRERDRELLAKRELTRLNEALAENDRRKDSFLAILAHELRNPLAPIQTCVDLIRRAPDAPLTPKMIDVLERQTAALARLVDDLLDVSRIKADKIALRPEPLDLAELIDNAVSSCSGLIESRRHALAVEPPARRIEVIADSVRLAQVVCNLLTNAARYTEPGGRITVSCGADDTFAWLRVRDTGIGIPAELQTTIFDMFVQERVRPDGSGGLGLGLALARRLVEMHNGSITVESRGAGKGSLFEVRLPLASSPLALAPRTRTGEVEPLARPASPPGRIAVIDDNDDARELLSDLLRANGYEVLTATTAATGRDLIRTHRPSVAIVDLGLPDTDGITLVEQLRAQCPDLETRLIALTGYGTTADRERTRRAGFHAHLVKPSPVSAILACIAGAAPRHADDAEARLEHDSH